MERLRSLRPFLALGLALPLASACTVLLGDLSLPSGAQGGAGGQGPSSGGESGAEGGQGGEAPASGGRNGGASDGAGSGGAASSGGSEAAAGGGPAESPALDEPCERKGQVACDRDNPRQTLLCSQGHWTGNGGCGEGESCNPSTGSCSSILGDCEGRTEGDTFCAEGDELRACGPNLVSSELVETCAGHCLPLGPAGGCLGPKCGDGKTQSDEDCDDGNTDNDDDCTVLCKAPFCGDGLHLTATGTLEACDEGGDTRTCDADCSLPACGDGAKNATFGESCDPNTGATDNPYIAQADSAPCDWDCTPTVCGDGHLNKVAELCDDAGESATCDTDCTPARCGDGQINLTFVTTPIGSSGNQIGEACDPGTLLGDVSSFDPQLASESSAACDIDCTPALCGDGYVNLPAGEVCDQGGNTANCDADCTVAVCGDGLVNSNFVTRRLGDGVTATGEICDPNTGLTSDPQVAAGDTDECDRDCTTARCGDLYTNSAAGEACDNDAAVPGTAPRSGDGCSSTCQIEGCGDGDRKGVEACDPGTGVERHACTGGPLGTITCMLALQDAASCDWDCTAAECGDGHRNAVVEQCDDGNLLSGDGCSGTCQIE